MGGERFDTPQPEAYLFGDNADLNFLGNKPAPFPYQAPQPNEPTKTLKSLINIRKESLKFVKVTDDNGVFDEEAARQSGTRYNIEFVFDSDVKCYINIYYFCIEEITSNGVIYTPKNPALNSDTFAYKRGAGQTFSQPTHAFDPSKFSADDLTYNIETDVIPVVIQCVVDEGDEPYQAHMLLASVERANSDNGYLVKPMKQKQFVDGLCYLLQEIYGIENKNAEISKSSVDDEIEENGSECVICMCDLRDTLILPCRHLCLCYCCADSLRYQANNCPICRAPFRALLQIKALRKATAASHHQIVVSMAQQPAVNQPPTESQEHIAPGYEAVSLIEALNGPTMTIYEQLHGKTHLPPKTLALGQNSTERVDRSGSIPTAQDVGTSPSLPSPVAIVKTRDVGSLPLSLSRRNREEAVARGLAQTELSPDMANCPLAKGEVSSDIESSGEQKVVVDRPLIKIKKSNSTRETGTGHHSHRRGSQPTETTRLLHVSGDSSREKSSRDRSDSFRSATVKSVGQAHSLVEVSSTGSTSPVVMYIQPEFGQPMSSSTPDSLHLCERHRVTDASPGADDSDYYTPEDPNTTILCMSAIPADDCEVDIAGMRGHVADYCRLCEQAATAMHTRHGSSLVRMKNPTPLCLDSAVSLPSSPRNQAVPGGPPPAKTSGMSSADSSFSSTSSTRLLLTAAPCAGHPATVVAADASGQYKGHIA